MKRIKGHDTGLLVIPKTVLLEAVRGTGHREHITEVYLSDVDHPNKEILPYTCFLTKYGLSLEPGHKQTLEVNSRPLGFPKPYITQGSRTDLNGYPIEEDPEKGEKREQGMAFKYPTLGKKRVAVTPVFGKRGQGARDDLKRRRKPRNPELARLLTPENLTRLCAERTQTQIMREIKVSRAYLCAKLKEFGLKALPGKAPNTDKDPEIIRMARTMTVTEIAQALGISRMSVYQKLYRLGIKAVRGRRGPQPKRGGAK